MQRFSPGAGGAGLGEGVVAAGQVGDDSGWVVFEQVTGGAGDEGGRPGWVGCRSLGSFPDVFQDVDEVEDEVDP